MGKYSDYKYVSKRQKTSTSDNKLWIGEMPGRSCKSFNGEREAAKWIDLQLIRLGKDPVNILKKV